MVHYNRAPLFYHPFSRHLNPYTFAGEPKAFFYQPTSGVASEDVAMTNYNESAEQQLAQKNEEPKSSSDSSVIYQTKNIHIQDSGDAYTFSLDLPGIKRSDAKVELRDGVLRVEAERRLGNNGSAKQVQHFLLKDHLIDQEAVKANLADGVLTITVPKKANATPVIIRVVAGSPPESTEDAKEVRLTLDLPGVKASDLKLELHPGSISLHAERKVGGRVTAIDKHFAVDQTRVDFSAFNAFMEDGILTITGYRKDAPEPIAIPVSDASTPPTTAIESAKGEEVVVETVPDEQ